MLRKVSLVLSIISAIAMIIVVAAVMPETVPHHYGLMGEADRWGSKWIYAVFALMPFIIAATYEIYRKRTNNNKGNQGLEDKLIPLISLMFIIIFWVILPVSGKDSLSVNSLCFICLLLGLLMTVISNYSGKIRPNRHLGIKVPWTLKNETVWKKTHRVGGFSGIIGGLVMVVFPIIGMFNHETAFIWCMVGMAVGIIMVALVPVVYSYCLYKKLEGRK